MFVYSGHGWSDGSTNYVVGVDAPDFAVRSSSPASRCRSATASTACWTISHARERGLKVAIIDACRDNPFHPPQGQRGYGLSRGLKPQSVEGSFVIYSAGEGQSAMDRLSDADGDPNSVFTRTLLPVLRADVPLIDAIKRPGEDPRLGRRPSTTIRRRPITTRCWARLPLARMQIHERRPRRSRRRDDDRRSGQRGFPRNARGELPDGPLKERAKARAAALKAISVKPSPIPADYEIVHSAAVYVFDASGAARPLL